MGATKLLVAQTAVHNVTNWPRPTEAIYPNCFMPLAVKTFQGNTTVITPVSSHIF